MNSFSRPTMLMILDGFGISPKTEGNAIAQAKTPNLDRLFSIYPHTKLQASGLDVGLPYGQMGNSEVGHLNIGAGRIVYQELTKITKEIENGSFFQNTALKKAMKNAADGRALHLLGLLSDGGVHSQYQSPFFTDSNGKKRRCQPSFHSLFPGRQRCTAALCRQIYRRT